MSKWICQYCGGDTSSTDMDYLVAKDHLSCVLQVIKNVDSKKMKIKNWDKISGFTYKGYCIVNPIHNSSETKYSADILNLNQSNKPKGHISVLTPAHKFVHNEDFYLSIINENNVRVNTEATHREMASVGSFRGLFEKLIDELIQKEISNTATYNSHSVQSVTNGANTGILNVVNQMGSNIVVSGTSNGTSIQYNLIDTIKELQKQIDELKTKLNPPINPFI